MIPGSLILNAPFHILTRILVLAHRIARGLSSVLYSSLVEIGRLVEEEVGSEFLVLVACKISLNYHVALETEAA